MELRLFVAVPPSVNTLYATVKGRRVLSKRGRDYKKGVGWQAKSSALRQGFEVAPDDRFALHMVLHFPDDRRRDLSNTIKVLEDSIAEALGFDDCRIDGLYVERGTINRNNPHVAVILRNTSQALQERFSEAKAN